MSHTETPIATIQLPALGTYVPGQGGHFAGIRRGATVDGVQQQPVALIVAKDELAVELTWGTYGKKLDGCDSRLDGHANTLAMLAADYDAAKHVRGLTVDGHTDFFLPSVGELNIAAANAPELFKADGAYWTSTQDSSLTAFAQDFECGGSYWDGKDLVFWVCAFRVIPLETLITSTL